jgi:hypothetical protein
MTEHRLPQRGDSVRDNELRGLHRVVGVEVVVPAHVAGQIHYFSDGPLRRRGVVGLERRQGVGHQPAECVPPLRPLSVVYPAVSGHIGAGLGQLDERRHLAQNGGRVGQFLLQRDLRPLLRAQLILDARALLCGPSPVEGPQDLAETRVVVPGHHGVKLITIHPVRRHGT